MNSTTIDPQATSLARPTADPPILPSVKLATIPDVVDVGDTAGHTAEAAAILSQIPFPSNSPYREYREPIRGNSQTGTECPTAPLKGRCAA